ncbi:MAG: hypothetical protein ACRELE_11790 [Gemmatimonadales bacterium]
MSMPRYLPRCGSLIPLVLVFAACRAPFETGLITPPPPPPPGPLLPLRIGSDGPDFARAVATDAAGNGYVVSYFANTVDFDAGPAAVVRTAVGPYDIALTKYAADGSFQWVFVIGGTDADVPFNVKLAPDGGLYVTGYVSSGALCNGHVLPNAGDRDILLMRISAVGTCDWAIAVGGPGADEGHDLAVAANGDVLVTGSFSGTVDFDPGPGTALLVSRGGTDGFVARYALDGTFRSVTQFGGTGDDAGNAIALRADGDIMIAGTFNATATFGSALAPQLLVSAGGSDFFLARLAPTLGLEWAIRGGGPGNDAVHTGGIVVASNNITYVTGTFTGSASLGPGAGSQLLVSHGDVDVFIANYDDTGVWASFARTIGGIGTDGVSAFARDAGGNFYLGGSFQDAVDFDPGAGTRVVNALGTNGAADAYVLSLTPTGDLRWVDPVGASISGDANVAITGWVSLASDGSIWAVGRFFGLADFDPGPGAVQRQSLGDADQFVVRYDQATGAIRR